MTKSAGALSALLTAAGATHLFLPRVFRPLIPDVLGEPDRWVYASGMAELAVATALIPTRTRQPAALAAAALFIAVFPGNLQHVRHARQQSRGLLAATIARLPVQALLVGWALSIARQPVSSGSRTGAGRLATSHQQRHDHQTR